MKKYNSNMWTGTVFFGGRSYAIGAARHDDIMKAFAIIKPLFSDAALYIKEMEV